MHFTRRPDSKLGQICAQTEALEVYFPMEQTSHPNSFFRKVYGPKSEGMSYFTNSKMFQMSYFFHPMSELSFSWAYLEYFWERNVSTMSITFKIQCTPNKELKPYATHSLYEMERLWKQPTRSKSQRAIQLSSNSHYKLQITFRTCLKSTGYYNTYKAGLLTPPKRITASHGIKNTY